MNSKTDSETMKSLGIFKTPGTRDVIEKSQWVRFRPLGQSLDSSAPVDLFIPGAGTDYLDLARSLLEVKLKVINTDGSDMLLEDEIGIINNILHSLWSQIDVYLNTVLMSSSDNYHYTAYFDTLLFNDKSVKDTRLQCQGFFKDTNSVFDTTLVNVGGNEGLLQRYTLIKLSKECQFSGNVLADVCKTKRFIINGVDLHLRLWPNKHDLLLVKPESNAKTFKIKILDVAFNACKVSLKPEVFAAQHSQLFKTPAIYPYTRTRIQTNIINTGTYQWREDNVFQFERPSRIFIAFVKSTAYSGSLTKNPFNFLNMKVSSMGLYVDGVSIPNEPMKLNFENESTLDGYHALFTSLGIDQADHSIDISREDFNYGYAIFSFDLTGSADDAFLVDSRTANIRIECRFDAATSESITAVILGHFPDYFEVDATRNIIKRK